MRGQWEYGKWRENKETRGGEGTFKRERDRQESITVQERTEGVHPKRKRKRKGKAKEEGKQIVAIKTNEGGMTRQGRYKRKEGSRGNKKRKRRS